jgi:hypothetical protein
VNAAAVPVIVNVADAPVPEVPSKAMAELLCGVICPARGERRVFGIVDAALGDRRESRDRLVIGRAQLEVLCRSFRCCSICVVFLDTVMRCW